MGDESQNQRLEKEKKSIELSGFLCHLFDFMDGVSSVSVAHQCVKSSQQRSSWFQSNMTSCVVSRNRKEQKKKKCSE